jgi:hypothetical protein
MFGCAEETKLELHQACTADLARPHLGIEEDGLFLESAGAAAPAPPAPAPGSPPRKRWLVWME